MMDQNELEEFKKDTENCVDRFNTLVETIDKLIEDGKAVAKSVVKVFNHIAKWFKSLFHVTKKVEAVDTAKIAGINEIIGA